MKLSLIFAASVLLCACSSSPDQSTDDAAADVVVADVPVIDASTVQCADAPKSKCAPANPGSVIRGVATIDPNHYAPGAKVNLGIFLYHQWVMDSSEATNGGHPHAYKYVKNVDVTTGQVPFVLDMCELGVAMYSEENCGFNLVVMFDENGDNNPDVSGQAALVPTKGELVKMTPVDVSCHGDSQCLGITADCVDGKACTTYTPIAMSACKCAANACPSQSVICTSADAGASDANSE